VCVAWQKAIAVGGIKHTNAVAAPQRRGKAPAIAGPSQAVRDAGQIRETLLERAGCPVEQENVMGTPDGRPSTDRDRVPVWRYRHREGLAHIGVVDIDRQPQNPQQLAVRKRPHPYSLVV
jgi:hypothetical protein